MDQRVSSESVGRPRAERAGLPDALKIAARAEVTEGAAGDGAGSVVAGVLIPCVGVGLVEIGRWWLTDKRLEASFARTNPRIDQDLPGLDQETIQLIQYTNDTIN